MQTELEDTKALLDLAISRTNQGMMLKFMGNVPKFLFQGTHAHVRAHPPKHTGANHQERLERLEAKEELHKEDERQRKEADSVSKLVSARAPMG